MFFYTAWSQWVFLFPFAVFTFFYLILGRHRHPTAAKILQAIDEEEAGLRSPLNIYTNHEPPKIQCRHFRAVPVVPLSWKFTHEDDPPVAWYCPDCKGQLEADFVPPSPLPQPRYTQAEIDDLQEQWISQWTKGREPVVLSSQDNPHSYAPEGAGIIAYWRSDDIVGRVTGFEQGALGGNNIINSLTEDLERCKDGDQ